AGIRDFHVTGVQTCALPISLRRIAATLLKPSSGRVWIGSSPAGPGGGGVGADPFLFEPDRPGRPDPLRPPLRGAPGREAGGGARSEERRVGKEYRCGWLPQQ